MWSEVFEELAKKSDTEEVFIDSIAIEGHQHAAGTLKSSSQAISRLCRGGGKPVRRLPICDVTAGQSNGSGLEVKKVVADKAYDAWVLDLSKFAVMGEGIWHREGLTKSS